VKVTYFPPGIGSDIEQLFTPETRAVVLETPGSLTFEVPDVPAICLVAHEHDATVLLDNTWATPLFFRPFEHGVDISIHAATKYLCGHSDAMLGLIVLSSPKLYKKIKAVSARLGCCPGPDDCYLVLRGIRTLYARLRVHQENAMTIASWLEDREEVHSVLYPALPSFPSHDLWKRDFLGASGLFSVVLNNDYDEKDMAAMLDGLRHFSLGFSWGGFESLALPVDPTPVRTATMWDKENQGPVFRLHIGLESPADLIVDLSMGFMRLCESRSKRAMAEPV